MNILILGSEGFIGSHLVKYYMNLGFRVFGCDLTENRTTLHPYFQIRKTGDESGLSQWDRIFSVHSFEFCINAAGSADVGASLKNPLNDFDSNVADTLKILDSIRRHVPACRYIHLSSAAVYGNPQHLPVHESAAHEPVSPYGWHKLMAESACREYHSVFGLPIAIARPFSIYGPGLRKQLFWDTFRKFRENGSAVELWGTGNESRDFLFIDDVVRCLDLLLHNAPMKAETYNIGSGNEVRISDAVEGLFRHVPCKPAIRFNNRVRAGDPLNWQADVTHIERLGFKPVVPFETGIERLARWLMAEP